MIRKNIISLLFFCQIIGSSQEWYPIGSTMCYQGDVIKYEVIGDTIIEDISFKIIEPQTSSFLIDSQLLYLNETDDIVTLYWNGLFLTVFDFNALPEDTIVVLNNIGLADIGIIGEVDTEEEERKMFPFNDEYSFTDYPPTLSLSYVVGGYEQFYINNDSLRIQNISTFNSNFGWSICRPILENVGGIGGLFGESEMITLEDDVGSFRCLSSLDLNFTYNDLPDLEFAVGECSTSHVRSCVLPDCAFTTGINHELTEDSDFDLVSFHYTNNQILIRGNCSHIELLELYNSVGRKIKTIDKSTINKGHFFFSYPIDVYIISAISTYKVATSTKLINF